MEPTREQQEVIEGLALKHGRVAVKCGVSYPPHGSLVHATVPSGECRWLRSDGGTVRVEHNFSIDWGE